MAGGGAAAAWGALRWGTLREGAGGRGRRRNSDWALHGPGGEGAGGKLGVLLRGWGGRPGGRGRKVGWGGKVIRIKPNPGSQTEKDVIPKKKGRGDRKIISLKHWGDGKPAPRGREWPRGGLVGGERAGPPGGGLLGGDLGGEREEGFGLFKNPKI